MINFIEYHGTIIISTVVTATMATTNIAYISAVELNSIVNHLQYIISAVETVQSDGIATFKLLHFSFEHHC